MYYTKRADREGNDLPQISRNLDVVHFFVQNFMVYNAAHNKSIS